MARRRGTILILVTGGCLFALWGTPPGYHYLTQAGGCFLLAYVYANLTRPKDLR